MTGTNTPTYITFLYLIYVSKYILGCLYVLFWILWNEMACGKERAADTRGSSGLLDASLYFAAAQLHKEKLIINQN